VVKLAAALEWKLMEQKVMVKKEKVGKAFKTRGVKIRRRCLGIPTLIRWISLKLKCHLLAKWCPRCLHCLLKISEPCRKKLIIS
jgi:hypothetical protein